MPYPSQKSQSERLPIRPALALGRGLSLRPGLSLRQGLGGLTVLLALIAGCAVPGRLYRVAPPITGVISGLPESATDVGLRLSVSHRETPQLFKIQRAPLGEDGKFIFDSVNLAVAGHEYSKFYRAYLHYQRAGQDRVIWRGEFSRRALTGPIELACDLTRHPRLGQPCWVRDPIQHPWLIDGGKKTFDRLCAKCHGRAGDGERPTGTDTAPKPPDLRRIAERRDGRFDRIEIAEWIEGGRAPKDHGTRTMPAWGERLSAEYARYKNSDELVGATIDSVLVYLESIQRQ